MNLSKTTLITDSFKCPHYAFNDSIISFKACMGRQIAITATSERNPLYLECVECKDGKEITAHFNSYQQTNKVVNKSNSGNKKKSSQKRAKKGQSPYTSHFAGSSNLRHQTMQTSGDEGKLNPFPVATIKLKSLILAQSLHIADLASKNKLDEAIKRIGLLNSEVNIYEKR